MGKILFLICCLLIPLIGSCDQKKHQKINNSISLKKFIINDETPVDSCSKRKLNNRIVFFMSKHCPHCQEVKPIIRKIIKKEKLEKYYEEFDLAEEKTRTIFENCKCHVDLQFVPVLVVNCQVLPGSRPEKEYIDTLKKFKMNL